jgi:hypothetical protein
VGNQVKHVANPYTDWIFTGCTFEPLFSNMGAELGAGAVGMSSGLPAKSLQLLGCYFGDGAETGQQVQFAGSGLKISGGTLSDANILVQLLEGATNVYCDATMGNAAYGLYAGAAGVSRVRLYSDIGESVTTPVYKPFGLKGSTIQLGAGAAYGKIASPAAELAALKTAVDAIRAQLVSAGITEE